MWGTIWSFRSRRLTARRPHTTCQHCHRQFPAPFQLQCHIESVHTSREPSAVCKICELSFETDQLLSQHMKDSHKPGKMPCVCCVCDYRLSAFADVEVRFRTWHGNTNNLLCLFCLKIFKLSTSFVNHRLEALEQEGLSMFQVLATVSEPEGEDRAPNQESSVIQKARAIAGVGSWDRGHDLNLSSAATERDGIHHCEEHGPPSATQNNYKDDYEHKIFQTCCSKGSG